jgi:L-asparagine transporter-like permease
MRFKFYETFVVVAAATSTVNAQAPSSNANPTASAAPAVFANITVDDTPSGALNATAWSLIVCKSS